MSLRLALVGGPMYDGLYARFADRIDAGELEVVVHADHPTLNAEVAARLARGERIDVMSTHGKYAPSQASWLRPLDDLVDPSVVAALSPGAVELCRVEGALLSLPRVVDVRILWVRADRLTSAPDSWDDVVSAAESGHGFGMPGRESGLFGTFFELVTGAGGRLLADDVAVDRDAALAAVDTIARLGAAGPADLASWHYDDVDRALLEGRVDVAAAWPGASSLLRSSGLDLVPYPYPSGPERRVTYSGCHSWAIPTTCGDVDGAVSLLAELCGTDAHRADAASGSVCANTAVFAEVEPVDEIDARRLELTRAAIADQMITYPPLARFPEIEDPGWAALHEVLAGRSTPADAVAAIERSVETVRADEGAEA